MLLKRETTDHVLSALRRIMRAVELHSKTLEKHYGLTWPQVLLLKELTRAGEVPVGQLAKSLSLSHGTVTDIISRLEKKGLVKRIPDSIDKRRVLTKTTEKAEEVLDSTPSLLQERFVERFGKLHDWEQTLILSSLQRIANMMEAEKIKAAPILASGALNKTNDEQADSRVEDEHSSSNFQEKEA